MRTSLSSVKGRGNDLPIHSMTSIPVPSRRGAFSCSPLVAGVLLLAQLPAQAVDFPGVPLATPPAVAFPLYTPGGGSTGDTVRAQFLCPDAFLAAQNLPTGLVTRIGFALAGTATYDVFTLRAGATTVASLGTDWATNLPDQRVQRDLANVPIVGGVSGGVPSNQWVEFEIDQPIAWQPGEGLVVDLTTRILVPGSYLGTTAVTGGLGGMQRAVNFAYVPGAPAVTISGSGIALRFTFADHGVVTFGGGCAAVGATVPHLQSSGTAALGDTMVVIAADTLPGALGCFVAGFSRRSFAGGSLPAPLGGGCDLLVAPELLLPTVAQGTNAALGLPIPVDPSLRSAVVHLQWAQLDAGSPASVPLTFSDGGTVVVF
jgi:hypothetical protein